MAMAIESLPNFPLSPPMPEDLYFSESQNAWILSRHRDVLAALRSADLSQVGPPKTATNTNAKPARKKVHSEIPTPLLRSHTSKWQTEISRLASALLQPL